MKKLYDFQREAIDRFKKQKKLTIAFEMGLGKTFTSIMGVKEVGKRTLVCSPANLRSQWVKELEEHKDHKWLYVPYSKIHRQEVKNAIKKFNPDSLILDEAHVLKTWGSKKTQVTYFLAKKVPNVLWLTGTPFVNNFLDCYYMLKASGIWQGNREDLYLKYYDYSYVRIQGRLQIMPEKIRDHKGLLEMVKKQMIFKTWEDIRSPGFSEVMLNESMQIPKKIEQCSVFRYLAGLKKLEVAMNDLDILVKKSKKPIIFTYHLDVGKEIAKTYKVDYLHGGLTIKQKNDILRSFEKKDEAVLVCNILCAGVGLNIGTSDHVIFFESSWSSRLDRQAWSRARRLGRKDKLKVTYIKLMVEHVYVVQDKKDDELEDFYNEAQSVRSK